MTNRRAAIHDPLPRPGTRATRLVRVALAGAVLATTSVVTSVLAPPAAAGPLAYTVTTTNDVVDPSDGLLSLREAVRLANNDQVDSEILLPAAQNTVLSLCGPQPEDANLRGDLDVTATLVLRSATTSSATLTTSCTERHLDVHDAHATLTVRHIHLSGGHQSVPGAGAPAPGGPLPDERGGGSIQSVGAVVVESSVLMGNSAHSVVADGTDPATGVQTVGGHGGAVLAPSITVRWSRVFANSAERGGALANWSYGPASSSVVVEDSTVGNNTALWGGATYGPLVARRSTFSGNSQESNDLSFGGGGAGYGTFDVTASRFLGNSAEGYGGHLMGSGSIADSELRGGQGGIGGAVLGLSQVDVVGSVVSDNEALVGGGVVGFGQGFFDLVVVAGVHVDASVMADNRSTAFGGGALHIVAGGLVEVTGSILTGNATTAGPGAIEQVTPTYPWDGDPADGVETGLRIDRSQIEASTGTTGSVLADGNLFANHPAGSSQHGDSYVRNSTVRHSGSTPAIRARDDITFEHATVVVDGSGPAVFDEPANSTLPLGPTFVASILESGGPACDLADDHTARLTLSSDPGCLEPGQGNTWSTATFLDDTLPFSVHGTTVDAPRVRIGWGDHVPFAACTLAVDQLGAVRPQGWGCSPGAIERVGCTPFPCDDTEAAPELPGDDSSATPVRGDVGDAQRSRAEQMLAGLDSELRAAPVVLDARPR